ncbi:hypothetical protein ABIB00_002155 [Bradyrhizobium sp. LB14.3]|uniref:hypothetical protein n=1 Tax=Bradyrhizobium sp. LB14.3 TaxID=3156328 RepID=UPI003396D71A
MLNDSILRDERTWSLPPEHVPPKPLRAAQIARLGDTLDEFESAPPWSIARGDAEADYLVAVRDRAWFRMKKLETAKCAPSWRDGQRLRSEITDALCRFDEASTARELCDARAGLQVARCAFEVAQLKYRQARRRAETDERAGKNIVTLRGKAFRRRPK